MSLFPMFLKLDGRRCLVVGAGTVAEAKIESLLATAAAMRVVAPKATPRVRGCATPRSVVQRRGRARTLRFLFPCRRAARRVADRHFDGRTEPRARAASAKRTGTTIWS